MRTIFAFLAIISLVASIQKLSTRSPFFNKQRLKIPQRILDELKQRFPSNGDLVVLRGSPDFKKLSETWNPVCKTRPEVVFGPASDEQVQAIFIVLKKYDQPFVALSGGHDFRCRSTSPASVLSFKKLNKVEFDREKGILVAQPGVQMKQVHSLINGTDFIFIAGECRTVAVAGFTQGGGLNDYLSPMFGIAAETVIQAKLILANGEVVTATRDNEYSDLLWGLLGFGGGRLALVLEFTYQLKYYPERLFNVLSAKIQFAPTDKTGFIGVLKALAAYVEEHIPPGQSNVFSYIGHRILIVAVCKDCDLAALYAPLFKRFPPSFSNVYRVPHADMFIEQSKIMQKQNFDLDSLQHFDEVPKNPVLDMESNYGPGLDAALDLVTWDFLQVPGYFIAFLDVRNMIKNPNHTSYPTGAHWELTMSSSGVKAEDFPRFVEKAQKAFEELVKLPNFHHSYVNTATPFKQDEKYFYRDNLPKLYAIKQKYDPSNIFHWPQKTPF